ncbi:MAG: hypothetical protein CVU41_18885 [Chloroflexi bacterium HGW-Chloroflexi-3]|nr:MAG: hypothetical protein CVU41_18885 [Chloroflexi bacterium HGW-Chloroflexi-3]
MEIEVANTRLKLQVTPLGDPTDSFLKDLFTKFFNELLRPYPDFIRDCYKDLEANIHSYFDGKINNPPGQDNLFNNLTIIWKNYQNNGRVGEAQQFWQDILKIVLDWENSRNSRIHKGSLFYFWSQTAILQGQLDKGFFLIHSAYEEDVLTSNSPLPGTPAFKTVSLDYSDKGNLLFGLVEAWANHLGGLIARYQALTGSKFTLAIFRTKFLNQPPNRDILFSFTYAPARFYDFDLLPSSILKGDFTSLYELNSLFDLVLVTDSVIYSSISTPTKDDWKFINLVSYVLVKSAISLDPARNRDHFGYINSMKDADFEKTVNELLDQAFIYPDGVKPSRPECDLGVAYCLRNYSAHNIGSFPIIRQRYGDIRQSVFNALFLAIETK